MKKIKEVNISFYLLLILFMQIIISDFLIYFTGIRYIFAQAISLIINIIINIILIKTSIRVKNDFSKWDIIFFVILFFMFTVMIVFPDEFWDSYSYHLYLQKFEFSDKINNDFFPGRTLTSFIFPIVDRIFYLFRSRLGFRLGTIPSYLIFIVMFYQIKKIIKNFVNEELKDYQLSILSLLPMSVFIILQQIGTYYIDNFSISLLLEFTYILLFEYKDLFKNKSRLYFLSFLVGLIVCVKLTNAVYLVLPLLYILVRNIKDIKNIKWYDYIFLIIVAILPMFPYLIDTLVQTGSPVFPYYNTIFKSKYFANENWLDERYGPKNLLQFIIWPMYIMIFPNKGYEGYCDTDLNFVTGYIISIIYLLYITYKKIVKKEKIELSINIVYTAYLLYLYLTWTKFSIGYTRYAGIIPVLSSVLIIKLLLKLLNMKNLLLVTLTAYILGAAAYLGFSNWLVCCVFTHYDFKNQDVLGNLKLNFSCLLKDQDYLKYDIDGIWGVINDDSAIPSMLNVDDKIVQLAYGLKTGDTDISKKIYWDNVLNNDIYIPLWELKFNDKLIELDRYNFEITEITDILPNALYLENATPIYIVKVKYNENKTTPNFIIFDDILTGRR